MAGAGGRATFHKRQKERSRQEKQREKVEKRKQRSEEKKTGEGNFEIAERSSFEEFFGPEDKEKEDEE